LSLFLVSL